jgi:hypothetical protein
MPALPVGIVIVVILRIVVVIIPGSQLILTILAIAAIPAEIEALNSSRKDPTSLTEPPLLSAYLAEPAACLFPWIGSCIHAHTVTGSHRSALLVAVSLFYGVLAIELPLILFLRQRCIFHKTQLDRFSLARIFGWIFQRRSVESPFHHQLPPHGW